MVLTVVHITDDDIHGSNEVIISVADNGKLQIQPFNDSADLIGIDIGALGVALHALDITADILFADVVG